MRESWVWAGVLALGLAATGARAAPDKPAAEAGKPAALTREAINAATFPEAPKDDGAKGGTGKSEGGKAEDKTDASRKTVAKSDSKSETEVDPLVVKAQVLLDRARFSPGAVDGRRGENFLGALKAFAGAQGLPVPHELDRAVFDKLQATSTDPVVADYTITDEDAKGPFRPIPAKMEEQADLDGMFYTTPREMLAERFHMQRDLLSALNPDKPFDKAGTVIIVAAVPPLGTGKVKGPPQDPKVTRIEVDKTGRRVQAFGEDGKLVATYPASIGSEEKPAPSGSFKVKGVAFDPWYTYDPKYRFKGVKSRSKFSIHPGPNNPVGVVWIDLSIPSYGIHGTPEPEKVGKTESHGCIRLTNWDARDLALHTKRGATVDFVEK